MQLKINYFRIDYNGLTWTLELNPKQFFPLAFTFLTLLPFLLLMNRNLKDILKTFFYCIG